MPIMYLLHRHIVNILPVKRFFPMSPALYGYCRNPLHRTAPGGGSASLGPQSESGKFSCPHCFQKMERTPRPHLVEVPGPSCGTTFQLQGRIGHYRLERNAGSLRRMLSNLWGGKRR